MIKRSFGEKVFDTINTILLILIGFITLYPFWYVAVASVSDPDVVAAGQVFLWPVGFELGSYKKVLELPYILSSYGNTIFYAFVGTAVSLIGTILGAYPLSKRRLKGRKFFNWIMLFTMWFNAGMMPTFINLRDLHLLNNRWTMIIAWCISAFYVVLMRTYFESISDSLEESAKMDGANDWTVLLKIYLPLSVPSIMTIGLYYFVERWNSYFWSMIILTDESKVPLQVILRKLVVQMEVSDEVEYDITSSAFNKDTIVYATIMVATIPMIALYPFVQKFFVKGIMVGAIKG